MLISFILTLIKFTVLILKKKEYLELFNELSSISLRLDWVYGIYLFDTKGSCVTIAFAFFNLFFNVLLGLYRLKT
jgi:hypothetical protein